MSLSAVELYKLMAGVKIRNVPYKTVPQAATDLVGGRIDMMMANLVVVMPHVSAGKLRALAISSAQRWPALPDVPTMNEAGVPCGVLIAPVLPGLSDRKEQIEAVVAGAVEANATTIGGILLHLRPGVREHYLDWLARARPDLIARYETMYRRSYAAPADRNRLSSLIGEVVRRYRGRRR